MREDLDLTLTTLTTGQLVSCLVWVRWFRLGGLGWVFFFVRGGLLIIGTSGVCLWCRGKREREGKRRGREVWRVCMCAITVTLFNIYRYIYRYRL